MTGKRLNSGRAAIIRRILALMPNGATVAELKVVGNLEASHKIIGCTLAGMRRGEQVTVEMDGVRGIWKLTPELLRQYSLPPKSPAPPRRQMGPLAQRLSESAPTQEQKDIERQQIAAEIAAFQAGGGVIEVLGNTPLRPQLNRRQVIEGKPAARATA